MSIVWHVFPVFLCTQSECGKIRRRKTTNTDTFHGMTVSKWKQLIAEENEGTPKGNLNRSLNENQRSLVQKVIYCYTKSSKNNIDNFENHNYKLLLNIKNLNCSFVSNNCPSLINFRNLFRPWQFYPKPTSGGATLLPLC